MSPSTTPRRSRRRSCQAWTRSSPARRNWWNTRSCMPTNVVMPQMGESIAEGTIVRWIKKVGDNVDRDEPLFEISTDKVDAEIPSPGAGVLTEIKVNEGETVPVNSVVAVIGGAAEKPAAAPAVAAETAAAADKGLPDKVLPPKG